VDLDHAACYRALSTRDERFDGRLFVGVRTTGIYCRPICPARLPKPENVTFYASAAAAQEAGFRPCLRCRPELAPELARYHGTSNSVSRALALIELGALDCASVDALAERLGLGERQLRRLFERHLGAAPVAVAQTRRVLLAKQLVHDTELTMSQVAQAAGFGSTRRFNELFQRLFGRPPSALRRAGREQRMGPVGTFTVRLRYRPPYDWAAMLAWFRRRALPGIERVEGDSYARTFALAGVHGIVRVEPDARDALAATISVAQLAVVPELLARLRRMFDLAADPHAIGRQLASCPRLAPFVRARPGLRVPGAWDDFELSVRAVLSQQNTVTAAVSLAAKLIARHGAPLALEDAARSGLTHLFPTAAALASADLTGLGMPGARARALGSLAAAVARDPQLFDRRSALPETIARLRALPGVGEWTAQYIAMRALREPDAFPSGDVALMRALADEHGERPSARELLAYAERWRPFRAYAAQHLWAADHAATQRTASGRAA